MWRVECREEFRVGCTVGPVYAHQGKPYTYTLHPTPNTLRPTPTHLLCTLHPTPCNSHPTHTLHPTPCPTPNSYTPYPTPYTLTLHATRTPHLAHTLHATRHTLHATRYTPHPAPHTLYPALYTLHTTRPTALTSHPAPCSQHPTPAPWTYTLLSLYLDPDRSFTSTFAVTCRSRDNESPGLTRCLFAAVHMHHSRDGQACSRVRPPTASQDSKTTPG